MEAADDFDKAFAVAYRCKALSREGASRNRMVSVLTSRTAIVLFCLIFPLVVRLWAFMVSNKAGKQYTGHLVTAW
jgi:hypothetical protein